MIGENERRMFKMGSFVPCLFPLDGQRAQLNYQVQAEVHREGSTVHRSVQVRTPDIHSVSLETLNTDRK